MSDEYISRLLEADMSSAGEIEPFSDEEEDLCDILPLDVIKTPPHSQSAGPRPQIAVYRQNARPIIHCIEKTDFEMDDIVDAHYFMTRTQGNVYSLVALHLTSGMSQFIAASWRRSVYSFGYCGNPEGSMKPTVKEHSFTYIPSGAEIISIDAFNKSSICDDFHIGIAIAKAVGDPEMYLNIYSEQDLDTNCTLNIDSIAQNCFMLELKFFPYHLTHTFVLNSNSLDSKETVWLLSGSDNRVHVYREDPQTHGWAEADVSELFPELGDPPSTVLWIHVRHTHNFTRRVTVIGCDVGFAQVAIVNTQSNTVLQRVSEVFEGPVTQVRTFSLVPESVTPPRGFPVDDCLDSRETLENISKSPDDDLHLLVCSGNNSSCVFMSVEEKGFFESNKIELNGSNAHDACVCSCVCDLDMDGENEILLGTFGSALLVYKWVGGEWVEWGARSTAAPVHSLQFLDLVGDGSSQLVVQTSAGVHIMQHKTKHMFQVLLSRLNQCRAASDAIASTNI